ncbi:MAG: flagellar motor switch protein FliG [Spirochaetes bacterium]|nr:flagellar motor switch protein FliG [Spirochaetota bacterium]
MGNLLRHGINAYKKTINLNNEIQALEQAQPQNVNSKKHTHKPKVPGEFYKTGLPAKNLNQDSLQSSLLKETISEQPESKYRRVAKFLILIGSEQAAEILAELDPEQVNEISKEIALTKIIKPEERDEILAEFHLLFSKPYSFSGSSHGGIETARRILYAAKGPEKGEALLNKAVPESRENLFSFLEEFSPEQIVMILKTETAQTTALILSRLSSKLSAGTISKLPAKQKAEILRRMAHQREISPEILEQVSAALKEKVRNIVGSANSIEINGMQTLAAILKQGDYSFGDRIINELEKESPEVGKNLKEELYTLDDVINTIDRSVQEKLSTMPERDIAILLKGRGQAFRKKILSCVSAGRRQIIREESEILGAVSKSDCDAAANEFLAWFRKARESGEIILESDKDVFI